MKNNIKIAIVLLILGALVALAYFVNYNSKNTESLSAPTSYKNATYTISGEKVTLKSGTSVVPAAPGSASNVTTTYFGNEVNGDFDADGRVDVAFILTQNTGGTGTFYYVVAALNTAKGYIGSDAVLLGDRISPQTTELKENNIIVVNYAERKPGQSFAESPSVGKSIWLKLDPKTVQFGEVVQNFEGEADPSRMKLTMHTWNWVNTKYNDGKVVTPKKADKFSLTFKADGTFSGTTDCNGVGGEYGVKNDSITFDKMMSTLMYCDGSQEGEFNKMLQDSTSYLFTSKGELILNLKYDSGTVTLR